MVPKIHVHTQADAGTAEYVKFMWATMKTMANRADLLSLTVHCIGHVAALEGIPDVTLRPTLPGVVHGSEGHAACIGDALRMTGDGDIHVISDSDAIVVTRGWDDYVRKRLVTDSIDIMGTTYEDLGGFSSGATSLQTYKKLPTFTWVALAPSRSWHDLDVTPNKAHRVGVDTEELSKIYNLPVGYRVFGEAAWQVPQYIHTNKLTYEGWKHVKPSGQALVLKGLTDYHEEYHAGDIPIVVHHRGSLRHAYRSEGMSKLFFQVVDSWLARDESKTSVWTWQDDGSFEVTVTKPEPSPYVRTEPLVLKGPEWLKISQDGIVVFPRTPVARSSKINAVSIRPTKGATTHVRIEGQLADVAFLVMPPVLDVPYLTTVRNCTQCAVVVKTNSIHECAVPPMTTCMLLIDIDGVQRVN